MEDLDLGPKMVMEYKVQYSQEKDNSLIEQDQGSLNGPHRKMGEIRPKFPKSTKKVNNFLFKSIYGMIWMQVPIVKQNNCQIWSLLWL